MKTTCIHDTPIDDDCESCAEIAFGGIPATAEDEQALLERVQASISADPELRAELRTAAAARDTDDKKRLRATQEAWARGRMN